MYNKLNLGCGFRKLPCYVNIDNRPVCEPDVLRDIRQGLPFQTGSISEVRAYDFLEHIEPAYVLYVMYEIWRVLKHGGVLDHLTPSTDGRGAFQDPTHRSFWNINSWLYYMDDSYRKLIQTEVKFTGENRDVQTGPGVIHTVGRLRAVKE
jgi:predicted SAM-dependent methyltransferase